MSTDHGNTTSADVHDHVASRLAGMDQRYTGGRRRLVAALAASDRPLTLPDIVASNPEIPQSSAYRNLDVLEQSGVVRRITVGPEQHARFELAEPLLGHHHHLICLSCGAIEDIHLDDAVESMVDQGLAAAAATAGFTPHHHSLDLHGYCSECGPPSTADVPAP